MKHPRHTGFTLVEVLVALAVLAIALAGIMRVTSQAISTSYTLRERNLALWVAQNRLVMHQLKRDWPDTNTVDGDAEMAGAKWFWREQVSATPQKDMRRIEISVRHTADSKDSLVSLAGYLRHVPPTSGSPTTSGPVTTSGPN
jgi:general secretion pathway protein I